MLNLYDALLNTVSLFTKTVINTFTVSFWIIPVTRGTTDTYKLSLTNQNIHTGARRSQGDIDHVLWLDTNLCQ